MYKEKEEQTEVGRRMLAAGSMLRGLAKCHENKKSEICSALAIGEYNVNDMREDKCVIPINITKIHAAKSPTESSNSWI